MIDFLSFKVLEISFPMRKRKDQGYQSPVLVEEALIVYLAGVSVCRAEGIIEALWGKPTYAFYLSNV